MESGRPRDRTRATLARAFLGRPGRAVGTRGGALRSWLGATLALSLSVAGVAARAGEPAAPAESTRAMAALLAERAAEVDPLELALAVNDRTAERLGQLVEHLPLSVDQLTLRLRYARELLGAGRFEECVEVLDGVLADASTVGPQVAARARLHVLNLKAAAYLRMGEEQNCVLTSSEDACLLPIRGGGVHRRKEGATRAAETLVDLLALTPDDLRARWLLNVAHMTLGSYPEGVPEPFLIPPEVFASEAELPRFNNVAQAVGVDVFGLSGGAVLEDFDGDRLLDLMVSHMGLDQQTTLHLNRGDGTFAERTREAGLTGEVGGLNMVSTDYDNDGLVDVLILRGGWMESQGRFPSSLLRNEGDGRFRDVTVEAGLLRTAPTQTAVWLDYDGDGWLDLFFGNESTPRGGSHPCELFRNDGDGTFTEVAAAVGLDLVGFVKGATSGDFDNDGRPDLYLSLQGAGNVLLHNDGPTPVAGGTADGEANDGEAAEGDGVERERSAWRFTDVTEAAGVAEPLRSFATFFFDFDNDGWEDLFVAGYNVGNMAHEVTADRLGLPTDAARGRLYRNRGDGVFEDVTREAGLWRVLPAMGLNYGDLDGDGYLDIYMGTGEPDLTAIVGSRMFRNAEGRVFQDVTTAGNFGHLQKGHAIAFGDVDNDGDQDVFAEMGGALLTDNAFSALYRNPGHGHRWLGVDLVGVRSNRKALGARLEVTVETPGGTRSLHRTVGSGGSFGAGPFRQQIGLGDATRIVSLKVSWPATGETRTFEGLELDWWVEIREGEEPARSLELPRFALPDATGAPAHPGLPGH